MTIRHIISILVFLAISYGYVRWLEQRSLYYPLRTIEATPGDIGVDFEEVSFTASDGTSLHGWFVEGQDAAVTVVLCHGNGGNISHRLDKILFFRDLGVNIFLFDYRGYGRSKGVPSEQGLYRDARAAAAWARARAPATKLVAYGESLGGAVAIELARHAALDGLILEGTFTSVQDMAKLYYPWLPAGLLSARYDSQGKIGSLLMPKLMMHARGDEIVPFRQATALYEAAVEPKEFIELAGGHNDAFYFESKKLRPVIRAFLERIAP